MFKINYVTEAGKSFWFTLDRHMSADEFELKITHKRGYIISDGDKPIGIMRYNLFWDNTPFLNLIYLEEACHGKGFGKQAMEHWENEMRNLGHKLVMTSTQANEQAQHFYRKLGYKDAGCLLIDTDDAAELFFTKSLD